VFVLCDAAIRDPGTGKTTLVGVFDRIQTPGFPTSHGPFAIYFRLSGLNGHYQLRVEILGPDLDTVVAAVDFPDRLVIDDPLSAVDAVVNLGELKLPRSGRYSVRLLYNGQIADEFTLLAEANT
jgi:hypothetical protein